MAYLENDADLVTGDRILTSGGAYPPELIIGTVRSVQPERHGVCSYAALEPAVALDSLSTVFVIKNFDVES